MELSLDFVHIELVLELKSWLEKQRAESLERMGIQQSLTCLKTLKTAYFQRHFPYYETIVSK